MKKVFLVANAGFTLTNFRRDIILRLKELGHEVVLVCPFDKQLDPYFQDELEKLKVRHQIISLNRKGLNPFKDLSLIIELYNLFVGEKPDIVLNYTIKPVIYSSLAAKMAGVPSINSFITGLGHVFTSQSKKTKILKFIVSTLYKISLKGNSNVFFQNPDDLKVFTEGHLIWKDKTFMTNGSGVNLEKFKPSQREKIPRSFIFIGRLLRDKGFFELIEAFKKAKDNNLECRFYVCGALDELNPAAITKHELEQLIKEELFEYIPYTNDVPKLLADKEVFILPSHREGTPRSTLEAMAMGLPIITTDAPGCRETVKDKSNGFLVPVGNAMEIYDKISYFVKTPSAIKVMGERSLEIVKVKYDVIKVNNKILNKIGLL
ncbi:MAG: glycosyltransferase family 4 protein [Bdellovibrionota bacterium]|nr:glycosyltransferase family 4 protein [Bdellovibrionota bacterium]